ncbi:hypothetical protein [Aquimarina agarivorans]|uniref:hypothetical protein n=1 Tax=Aquimarina agarivorans TaxID=980584 RepID=UPI000248E5FE|nr:hypothetical protein [Aquimarina agarivorans]
MTSELRNIIDESYSVFSKYDVTIPLDICTECCMTPNQESELAGMSVNQIPFELLYEYNTAAKTDLPNIEEFKHFLPRFLELTAELKFLHHSAELILSRFEYYSIEEWTVKEIEIIQNYSKELFKHFLSIYPIPELEKIDSIIIMLYKAKVDMLEILREWRTVINRSSLLHLSDLVCGGFKGANNDTLSSGFADGVISKIVFDWLNTDYGLADLKNQIEEIIMDPKELGEWKLNELNWTYEKLNELDYKRNN